MNQSPGNTVQPLLELDRDVRYSVYRHFIATGRAPTFDALSATFAVDAGTIRASLQRLADAHALVLDPESDALWMAAPFSAIPSPYPVTTASTSYWANCAWDALGIPALLGVDATTVTACADCGQELTVEVRQGAVRSNAEVVHFLVPARDFWRDIGFT